MLTHNYYKIKVSCMPYSNDLMISQIRNFNKNQFNKKRTLLSEWQLASSLTPRRYKKIKKIFFFIFSIRICKKPLPIH